jgi:hypothetical protein
MGTRFNGLSLVLSSAIILLPEGGGGLAHLAHAEVEEGLSAMPLQAALSAAVTIPGARADIVALDRPAGECVTTGPRMHVEIPRPIDGSGRIAVKLIGSRTGGATCEVWAWARVRIFAQVPVARRAVREGDALVPATQMEEREIKSGHVPATLTEGATADRSLGAGQIVEADFVRAPGLRPGELVKVLIVSGAMAIEQTGHAVPCARGHNCAVLPSGKHIEGTFVGGRLMVQLP